MMYRTWHRRRSRSRSIAGFSLIEMIVVVIIIGVLFSIIAASWVSAMNRQRLNAVVDQAAQIIRQAQNEARTTKLARVVVFEKDANGVPRAVILAQPLDTTTGKTKDIPIATTGITTWQLLGNGEVSGSALDFETKPTGSSGQLVFNSAGAIDDVSVKKAPTFPNGESGSIFSVNVRPRGSATSQNRCVIVTTLVGGIRSAEGSNCP